MDKLEVREYRHFFGDRITDLAMLMLDVHVAKGLAEQISIYDLQLKFVTMYSPVVPERQCHT